MTSDDLFRAMEALDADLRDPWHFVRAILVHPDVREKIKAMCAPATDGSDTVFGRLAGFEILASVYAPKNRASLLDSDRRLLGVMDLTTGECYFAPERKPRYHLDPPTFSFAPQPEHESIFRFRDRYGMAIPPRRGVVHMPDPEWTPRPSFRERQRARRRANKIARRAQIKAENARRRART